jgi:protein phosphatase
MRLRIVQSGSAPPPQTRDVFAASAPGFDVAARTDVGRRRANNEDNFSVVPELGLFVLSDGMGGEAAGELASKITVEEVARHMKEAAGNGSAVMGEANPQFSPLTNHLAGAIRRSNRVIWEAAQHHASQRGMGATVVAAVLQQPVLSIAHVGDSRIYLLRDGQLQQLTQDHSLVMEQVRRGLITREEAEHSDMANIIIRALGAEETVKVDLDEVYVMPGDHVVLCSDGLTKMIPDGGIAQVVAEAETAQQASERLVDIANDAGGEDNITVVVVRIKENTRKGLWGWLKGLLGW